MVRCRCNHLIGLLAFDCFPYIYLGITNTAINPNGIKINGTIKEIGIMSNPIIIIKIPIPFLRPIINPSIITKRLKIINTILITYTFSKLPK